MGETMEGTRGKFNKINREGGHRPRGYRVTTGERNRVERFTLPNNRLRKKTIKKDRYTLRGERSEPNSLHTSTSRRVAKREQVCSRKGVSKPFHLQSNHPTTKTRYNIGTTED